MSGQRGGELRENPQVRQSSKRYRESVQAAMRACGIESK
jgi:hypothetical protein